ncbi:MULTISPECIES: P-loop NTPase [Acidiphilium]|uniref:CobQ/CobB/MinD/ParA nucleotide binding domain-containing protein n=1 Tax=Acidiphilium rubrum TaxID=526 RepID=A0A8G2CME9_ACIRU|nr:MULTISPECIES: P-loop NTPase [Acidiphilium]MBW4034944.1 P-loop NTPase [Pseudomonadota bacterium]SIR22491.1 CobQ/CobB/MinD/ParA nucleotide binding domain-containing protein [Acidiphilium rubrum]
MINSKTPRHLAERVAAELLPDAIAGLDRAAARVGPPPVAPKDREATLRPVELVPPRIEAQVPVQRQERLLVPGGQAVGPKGEIISRQSMEDAGMVVARGRRDQAGEEFRIVRQHILQSIGAMGGKADGPGAVCPNVVMVTSAKHGEGKSFTALNLANILAEGGDRPVVLIDADIGGNSLSRHFGLESRPGLLDLAVSPRQLANALAIPTEPDNLTFIPIGGGADGDERSDLSSRQPVRALVERLATQFRDSILVIDSPACLSNSDPMELAAIVGQIVLVVEAGQTRRKDVEGALDLIDACPNISLVLNRMTQRGRGSFAL